MRPIGSDEMLRLDEAAARDYSIPSYALMENAGRRVADIVCREYPPCKVVIFAGKGNNGGDGLVVARYLAERRFATEVVLLEDPARLKLDPLLNLATLRKMKIPGCLKVLSGKSAFLERCCESELVIDAVFGIGLHRPVSGTFEDAIRALNESRKPVMSIDIPSGLDADTGKVHGVAVKARWTVTLSLPKRGLFEGDGPQYAGAIEVVDIGLPRELLQPFLS